MLELLREYLHRNMHDEIPYENLRLQFLSHPEYPGIKSITDTLDYFRIENIAVNLPKDCKLPSSFIALMNDPSGNYLALVNKMKNKYVLNLSDGANKTFLDEEFETKWSRTMIAIEPGIEKKIGTENKFRNSSFTNILVYSVVVLFVAFQFISFTQATFLLSLLSLVGIYISYLITREELGIRSKIVDKVCRGASGKAGCSDVINSSENKIFNIVSLSNLSVTFFVGYTLINSLLGYSYVFSLIILTLGLPVILYSLYQQFFRLRKLCTLCLGISAIFSGQFIIALIIGQNSLFSVEYGFKSVFIFALIYTIWVYFKPALVSQIESSATRFEFLRFKRNQNIFRSLLHQNSIAFPDSIIDGHKIEFGAQKPAVSISAITNPMCGFCADAFEAYDQLMKSHKEEIRINLIFNVPTERLDNIATQLASSMVKIFITQGSEMAWQSLREWYKNRNPELWQSQFGAVVESDIEIIETLKNQKEWCDLNKIDYTPVTLIDGNFFPTEYVISDLHLLIPDFILDKRLGVANEVLV